MTLTAVVVVRVMKKQAGLNVQKENIQSKHGLVCVRSSRQKEKNKPPGIPNNNLGRFGFLLLRVEQEDQYAAMKGDISDTYHRGPYSMCHYVGSQGPVSHLCVAQNGKYAVGFCGS